MRWGDMDAMSHSNNPVYFRSIVLQYTLAHGRARGLVSSKHSEERCSSRKVNEARGTGALSPACFNCAHPLMSAG